MSKTLLIVSMLSMPIVLVADQAAFAQTAWCLNEPGAGVGNCGFHSFAQCQASRPGGSTYCSPRYGTAVESSQGAGRERRR
jgi:hypothetical protein